MPFFTASDGAKLFYEDTGGTEPLILIHGWACNHLCFEDIIPALSKNYRVIAVDLRGHGQSANGTLTEYNFTLKRLGQDLSELLNTLSLEQVTLMGWSMGCSVIYDFIRQFGCNRIKQMILIDMSPKTVNENEWVYGRGQTETFQDAVFWSAECAKDWNHAVELFIPTIYANGCEGNPDDMHWMEEQAKQNIPHGMVNLVLSMSVNDYRDVLPKISVPTLLLHGESSTQYGKNHGAYLSTQIPNCQFCVVPGGHVMFREYPNAFLKAVSDFLDKEA
ncbi:MAG: alpha/beta hydrolase [Oscillospiraceae bacterium]|nr:alpha/beta hydrolase [Oscillospiraceae bacterium]